MVDVLLALADVHAGSTTAICPPTGIRLDDGGEFHPSKLQKHLWKSWIDIWEERVPRLLDKYQPDSVSLLLNGDMVDGNHHGTPQIVSPLESLHIRIVHKCLELGPLKLDLDGLHVVRGTSSHVGAAGTLEEGLARVLREEGYPVVMDPDTGNATSYWRRLDVGGLLVDAKHHGRMGQRRHTRGSYLRLYAQDIQDEYTDDGERPPDVAVRAHLHTYGDSGRDHKMVTRVVALPCWQLGTEYSYRRAYERLTDIGAAALIVRDGQDIVEPLLADIAERPTVITVGTT
jgi:hypothetical protein